MSTFRLDKFYFDEGGKGIGSTVTFDGGLAYFDRVISSEANITSTLSLEEEKYVEREIPLLSLFLDFSLEENYSKYVDLMQLVPEKYRDSVLLQEFLEEVGILVGGWLSKITDIKNLLDKYTVGEDYLQYLADLVNLRLVFDDDTTLEEKRRQLIHVIDWYKMKGTYQSLQYIGYLLGLNLNIWDLYTADYINFEEQEWFVGEDGDNPGDLHDSLGYYKSPHIGIELALTKVYDPGSGAYLFKENMYTNLAYYIEATRPVNVVPEYSLYLYGATTLNSEVVEEDGEVKTATRMVIDFPRWNFDDSKDLDDGEYFDESNEAFLNDITKWSLATNNKGIAPLDSAFTTSTPVLTGTIDDIDINSERARYTIRIDKSVVQSGISELTLYKSDDTPVLDSTFPDIDKIDGVALKIQIDITF